jgi:hypothetical protein
MDKTKQCAYQCNGCGDNSKILNITWDRLVADGETCPRCGSTEEELDKAVSQLKKILIPLGIEVVLKKSTITLEEFKANPIKSNRILFNDVALENLVSAKTGRSQCCDVCGDKKCRTIEIKGKTHEVITADIIIKAGLKAVSNITAI